MDLHAYKPYESVNICTLFVTNKVSKSPEMNTSRFCLPGRDPGSTPPLCHPGLDPGSMSTARRGAKKMDPGSSPIRANLKTYF